MYTVTVGNDVAEHPTRAAAIASAKLLSAESRQAIFVMDESERERMTYQYGELESYTYETRHRRPPRERRDDEQTERTDKPAEAQADAPAPAAAAETKDA